MSHAGNSSAKGYALVLAATLIWSGNFIVARIINESVPPVTLVVLRSVVAIMALAPFVIRQIWADAHVIRKHFWYIGFTGFLGISVCQTVVYIAAGSSTTVNLTLIAICSPIFTMIFARIILKDALTFRRLLSLVIASVGVLYLVTGGEFSKLTSLSFNPGDVWMLAQASSFGLYSVLVQQRPVELNPIPFLFSMFVFGMLLLTPWFIWEVSAAESLVFTGDNILAILYLGLGPSVLAYMSWNKSVALIGPTRASMIYYCLPLFGALGGLYFLGEHLTAPHLISGVMILTGVMLSNKS